MKTLINFLIAMFVFLFTAGELWGQIYRNTRYADQNGLPSRIVRDIIQDRDGYLWVAGNNGLFRFDGSNFTGYYSALKDTTGLRDNKINALAALPNGDLLIGTAKGLHRKRARNIKYVALLDSVTTSQDHITKLFVDSRDNTWIGTYGGLFLIKANQSEIVNLSHEIDGPVDQKVIWGITEDDDGNIWIGNLDKAYRSHVDAPTQVIELAISLEDAALNKPAIYRIYSYDSDLYFVESNAGLLKARWRSDSLVLSYFRDQQNNLLVNTPINKSIVDSDNKLWLATDKERFKKFEVRNDSLIRQNVNLSNGWLGMSTNNLSVYQDAQQNVWIANSNGLFKLSPQQGQIYSFPPPSIPDCLPEQLSIYGMAEDAGGHLWVTTPFSLYRFNKEDIMLGRCPSDYLYFNNDYTKRCRSLYIDTLDRLWLATENGLVVSKLDQDYNPGKFYVFNQDNGFPLNYSHDIAQETTNSYWVGTSAGLVHFTLNNQDLNNPDIIVYESDKADTNSLVNSFVINLEFDDTGTLWAGTFSGVSALDLSKNPIEFSNYIGKHGDSTALSNNAIKKILKDRDGNIWVGTQTGLNRYNPATNAFIQLGRNEGLPSEYILGIAQDLNDMLWIATTNGVIQASYDQNAERFTQVKHFTSKEGLSDNITYRNALHIDSNNNVFIGSANGISIVTQEINAPEKRSFNLRITGLQVTDPKTNEFVSIYDLNTKQPLVFKPKQNSLILTYAALDFSHTSYNQYRHKFLNGEEDPWISTGNNSELSYYNLSPGNYTILLDGANDLGQWAKNPIRFSFTIKPPWYKSTLAMILYGLLLAGVLRFLYLYRINRKLKEIKRKQQLDTALMHQREQLRAENTADFHDELGAKVTKISLFLELAERSVLNKESSQEWFAKVRSNITDLSSGFRDLLWVIDPKKDSLQDTLYRLKEFGEDLFEPRDTNFSTVGFDINSSKLQLDSQTKKQLLLIFKEAMNNCAKYAQSSEVILQFNKNNGDVGMQLKDNGIGFNVSKQQKGRGLKNMKERANKIGCTLEMHSDKEGTRIEISNIPHSRD